MEAISFIPLANLMLGFLPVIVLIVIMSLWGLNVSNSIYANLRMLIQLLLIGYVLTFIFETDQPIIWLGGFLYDFYVGMDSYATSERKRNISFCCYLSFTCIERVGSSLSNQSIHCEFTKMVRTQFYCSNFRNDFCKQYEHGQFGW